MPYDSAQISGLIGGQMAMFANQASFSQQVGGMAGVGPMPMGGGGMQNPYPTAGSQIAGAMGMALPGMVTGAAIGGGIMSMMRPGSAWGALDPFTGIARGFARGAGMAGGGFGQVAGGLGRAFTAGGLRAGAGMMAGGLGGAAVAALPYALIGGAASTIGENIYAGAQNISDVQNLSQHFGAQWGQAGASDGRMGNQTIKNIVGVLHNLVGDDVRTTMDDLKRLMDQAGQMGMLTGINNAAEFKNRFTKIVRQVRDIADVMGTSMSEATPMFSQMRQMGLWTAQDVMGTAIAARVAGPAAGQMMQVMGQGAQMSHAMGGTMRAGAMMGRQAFMGMRGAVGAGVLSEQDVMEFTGGVGGAEGQRMMAQNMAGIMARFGKTDAGRLMMAGLGARNETGEFTGEIDPRQLQRFLQGDVSVGGLSRLGRRRLGKDQSMSFFRQAGNLSQNLGAEGGMEAMIQIVQQIADTRFKGSEQARHQLFQQMLGVSNREAELLGRYADELPRIQDQVARETEARTRRIFDDLERKQYRSWEGVSNAARGMFERSIGRPLQEIGENVSTSINQTVEDFSRMLTGRTRRIGMGVEERSRLLRSGALTADLGELGEGPLSMTTDFLPSLTMRMQQGEWGVASPQALALQTIGITADMSRSQARQQRTRAWRRAQSPTMSSLGLQSQEKLGRVKTALKAVIGKHPELAKIKQERPHRYTAEVMKLMRQEGSLNDMSQAELLDYASVANQEYTEGDLAMDFRADAARGVGIATTAEGLAEMQEQLVEQIASQVESDDEKQKRIQRASIPFIGGLLETDTPGFATRANKRDVEQALTGAGSGIFMDWMQDKISTAEARERLARVQGGQKVSDLMTRMEPTKGEFKPFVQKFALTRAAELQPEEQEKLARIVKAGPSTMKGIEGFEEAYKAYTSGDIAGGMRAVEEMAAGLSPRELERMRKRGGAIGKQTYAMGRVQRLGATLSEEDLKTFKKDLMAAGYDIDREDLKDIMKGGISEKEMGQFRGEVGKLVKTGLSTTRGAIQAQNKAGLEYIKANTDFVNAVNAALGGKGALGEASDALNGQKADSAAASPGLLTRMGRALISADAD